ncbi:hypothetical protein Tco_1222050, partial [Tanacetum coccineum]
ESGGVRLAGRGAREEDEENDFD